MDNPWKTIPLSTYESHMRLSSVLQLQTMNAAMRSQLTAFPASSVMILGVAGGNGLEHIPNGKFQKVYAVDVNPLYLEETARRYPGVAECVLADLRDAAAPLPEAELVIANLLGPVHINQIRGFPSKFCRMQGKNLQAYCRTSKIFNAAVGKICRKDVCLGLCEQALVEYIGCPCFRRVLDRVKARFASCLLQVDLPGRWVSDSPYLHAFDGLDAVHRPIEERALTESLPAFRPLGRREYPLPNGKKLLRLDFQRRMNQENPL